MTNVLNNSQTNPSAASTLDIADTDNILWTMPEHVLTESPDQPVMTTKLAKNIPMVIARAQQMQASGHFQAGRKLLIDAIRHKNWKRSKLWWRLVPMMESADDYRVLHDFWLESPAACHANASILRAIARAAAVSGNHHDCRVLLRKLIMLLASRHRPAPTPLRIAHSIRDLGRPKPAKNPKSNPALPTDATAFAARATVALTDLNAAFSEINLRAFLISGTLLGQVREGRIIGWDKDIDVGYFTEECSVNLEEHFLTHGKFRLGRIDFTSDRLRLIHKNGMWIDIFPHYMENGCRWHNGTATRWWNTPFGLSTINFIGIDQFVPDDPERYLDENYGDWRTPNADFDARIDAPNAEISDQEHFVSLLYFSLEKSIRGNKPIMKQRYIELLRKHGEGSWLDRI